MTVLLLLQFMVFIALTVTIVCQIYAIRMMRRRDQELAESRRRLDVALRILSRENAGTQSPDVTPPGAQTEKENHQ